MEEELKTIKDIVSWTCECNCVTFDNEICRSCGKSPKYGEINYDDIKAEAIKILKSDTKDLCDYLGVKELSNEQVMVIDLLIKKSCNITEKDLDTLKGIKDVRR